MIEAKKLSKHFGAQQVLAGIDVTIPSGSITAVIGPNGSGKTTFMKSIIGLVKPSSGSIFVLEREVSIEANSRKSVGYMSQIANYPENLTPHEIISMVSVLQPDEPTHEAQRLIDLFQLTDHLHKSMKTLSGGTRQKVSAVLALMFRPQVLLLDEPTAGLDPVVSERLKKEITNRARLGATVVVTSHVLAEIEQIADRVVYLVEGNVIFNGAVTALLSKTHTASLVEAIVSIMENHSQRTVELS